MGLSNKKINISTTGDVYSTNYSTNLSNSKSLVCKYNYSNENNLIDKESTKYIDNIMLSNIYTNVNDLLGYNSRLPFNIIYNLFDEIDSLPANIFKNCQTLENVSQIPFNYTKIEHDAFNGCYNLKNINIHTNIIELEDSVFDGCKMLQSINASNLLKIGKSALAGTGIESISLNENIGYLSPFVFSDCYKLKSFSFENPLEVYEGAFAGCTSLTSVEIEQYKGVVSNNSDIIVKDYSEIINPDNPGGDEPGGNDNPDTPVNPGGNDNPDTPVNPGGNDNLENIIINCNFENEEILFTSASRVTLTNENFDNHNCLKILNANNSQNGYSNASYNFSDKLSGNEKLLVFNFDLYFSGTGPANYKNITIGDDSSKREYGKNNYVNTGAAFNIGIIRNGSANVYRFAINNEIYEVNDYVSPISTIPSSSDWSYDFISNQWIHISVSINTIAKKISCKVLDSNQNTIYNNEGISYLDDTINSISQIEYCGCLNNDITYIDNLVIKSYNYLENINFECDFENGETLFISHKDTTNATRITISNGNFDDHNCLKILTPNNSYRGHSIGIFDFSNKLSLDEKIINVKFDFYLNITGAVTSHNFITFNSNLELEYPTNSYNSEGTIFNIGIQKIGSYRYFVINNQQVKYNGNSILQDYIVNKWIHADITINLETKKISYIVTTDPQEFTANNIDFIDTNINDFKQIQFVACTTGSETYIDNLFIEGFNNQSYGTYNRSLLFGADNSGEDIQISSKEILPNYIFASCKKLDVANNVSFIDNIKIIGVGSLMNCTSLKELYNDIRIINNYGFKDCINLNSIDLKNCEFIGNYAFKNCQSLKTVDINKLKSMDNTNVFENCVNLRNVVQSNSINKIGDKYFKNCKSLLSFDFSNIEEIGKQSFYCCESLGLINIIDNLDDEVIDFGGKNIYINTVTPNNQNNNENNEDNSINATYISGSDTIDLINPDYNNDNSDNNIANQTTLDLLNVKDIDDYAFYGCSSITEVKLNSEVTLGEGVFMNCTSLKSIELPQSIYNFTYNLFNNCTSLRKVKFNAGISENIELSGLSNCNKINSIEIPNSDKYKVINNECIIDIESNTIIYVVKDLSILNITEEYGDNINIDDNAFNNCNLSIINISEDIKAPNINEKTFANIINNKFHVLISRNDSKYNKYINILGSNKIYYI